MGHSPAPNPQGQGMNFLDGAVWERLGNMGSMLHCSLAPTKPHHWFCSGVRLPGKQLCEVEGGVGACVWVPRDFPFMEIGLWSSVPGLGELLMALQKESEFQARSRADPSPW